MRPGTRYRVIWAFGPTQSYEGIYRERVPILPPVVASSMIWWKFEDGLLVNPSHVANVLALES
jgi:hypothetical protein